VLLIYIYIAEGRTTGCWLEKEKKCGLAGQHRTSHRKPRAEHRSHSMEYHTHGRHAAQCACAIAPSFARVMTKTKR
jgi:hypothetical protein